MDTIRCGRSLVVELVTVVDMISLGLLGPSFVRHGRCTGDGMSTVRVDIDSH